jgi:outer membrane protein assembly factor BamA
VTSAVLATLLLFQPPAGATVTEIRVHGNATISDAMVIQLAGIAVGATIDDAALAAIEKRLRDSGRFDAVQVRRRYRTMEMDQVALVLLVHERPGVTAVGQPPGVLRQIRARLMFFPILYYDDGYGWTYGATTTVVNVAGKGTRVALPLSWGATKAARLEVDRTFTSGPLTRATGSFGIQQRQNPHFLVDDRRAFVKARIERRVLNTLTFGGEIARTQLTFEPLHDRFWTPAADVTLDTRRDPAYPSDAVFSSARWSRMSAIGATAFGRAGSTIDRYQLDARGFKRLFKQNVLALHAEYDTASAPLPPYEQYLLEGWQLRGSRAGSFAGDKRFIWSAEVRVPFSSPLDTVARTGVNVFVDGGTTALYGQRIADQREQHGAGAGLWAIFTVVQLNVEVAHSLDGRGTRVQFGTGFSF